MAGRKTALVISAHSADFVWRAGGAIALHQKKGYDVTIVCLSYGERGESAKLWKQPGCTLEHVKTERRKEAEAAAKALNAHDIQFFDCGDYPLELDREAKFRLADLIRKVQPTFMMSHSLWDPYNTDHMYGPDHHPDGLEGIGYVRLFPTRAEDAGRQPAAGSSRSGIQR